MNPTEPAENRSGLRERAERSEALAAGILRTAVDPIIVIDAHGVIANVNDATVEMFGYARHELVGRNVSRLMPASHAQAHDGYIERYLAEGDPRIIGTGREVEAQRSDGSRFPVSLAVSEVKTGTDHFFTGILHDLTERNRQRDQLQASNAELESRVAERTRRLEALLQELRRSNRDLEHFAYLASHDLRTPLRNVRQGMELLGVHLNETLGHGFDDEARELQRLIEAAIGRMEDLISGLLDYSQVQRSAVSQAEVHDTNALVEEVVNALASEIERVEGSVEVGNLPALRGNGIQLRQVFQNLIENAIRYRSPNRPLQVTIRSRVEPTGTVRIEVADNGSGIDASLHERIFELFRQGHRNGGGVGIGLAVCKRVLEGHDGDITVESTPDAGSTFVLSLPAL